MAGLTDRSLVPLKPSDFKVIHGERRLSDVRLAERLGFDRVSNIRNLIERWQSFLEQQSEKVLHREALAQTRGFAGHAFWLNIPEVIFIAGKSEAKNADVVQYEAALIAAHWVQGEQPPDDAAPTLRALAAPDRPQIVPTEAKLDNSVQPIGQHDLFGVPDELGQLTAEERLQWIYDASPEEWDYASRETFQIECDGLPYDCILRRDVDGDPFILWVIAPRGYLADGERPYLWVAYHAKQVMVRISDSHIDGKIIKVACRKVRGLLTPMNEQAIDVYFDA